MFPHNPVRNETRKKPAISACAIDKNGRGGKNIRLIPPIKSSANAPADFGGKFAGIFPYTRLCGKRRQRKNSRLSFTGYAFPSPRGARGNAIEISPRAKNPVPQEFFCAGTSQIQVFQAPPAQGARILSHTPAGRREKPKNLAKTGENACKESLFLRLYTARSGPMQFAAARTPPDPEGSNGSDLPNVPWVA